MTKTASDVAFPVRFTGASKAMVVLGMHPGNSHVTVTGDDVEVRMGWAFAVRFRRSSVASAAEDHDRVRGWGVHGWKGQWLVNGSSSGLVRIELAEPVQGRLLGIPVTVRTLRVAVQDAAALVATLV